MNKVIFLLFYLFLNASSSYGQNAVGLDGVRKEISINDFVFISKKYDATINDIDKIITATDTEFIKNKNFQEVDYGFNQASGWCKVTIKNNSNTQKWILKVHQSRVDSVELFVQKENEDLIKYPITGHFQNIKDRPVYSFHFAYTILLNKGQSATCYLYTQRKFGRHAAVLSIQQENYFLKYSAYFTIAVSVVLGIVFLAGLVGIILCFFVPRKVFVFYSIYCFAFLLLVLTDTGFLHAFFNNIAPVEVMNNTNMIFYYWVVGWHIIFSIELLEINKKTEKWTHATGYTFGILFCLFAVILLFPVPGFIRKNLSLWSYYIFFFVDAYILYVILIKIARKKVIAYFYLVGFLFTLCAATIMMLADLQILKGFNQNADLFIITPVVEIIFMSIGLGIHFSNNIKEKLNSQLQLNKTQNEIISIQEYERKRIAQDLHDDVGNSLMALKNILIHNKESHNIENEIDNILDDIRNISHDLMPVNFNEYALTDILRQTINKFKNHPTTCFEFDETGKSIKLKSEIELIIYRIVNELISNITKHAKASQALIQLIYQDESLIVMAEDNGLGMKNKNILEKNGLGLYNIRHRVAYINGQINIESDQKGTLVIIEIPYAKNS